MSHTMIDTRLLDQIPARVKTLLLLSGTIHTGHNEDLDHPTDCAQWLRVAGEDDTIDQHLNSTRFTVENTHKVCWIYQGVHN